MQHSGTNSTRARFRGRHFATFIRVLAGLCTGLVLKGAVSDELDDFDQEMSCASTVVRCDVRYKETYRVKPGFWGHLSGAGGSHFNAYTTETTTEVGTITGSPGSSINRTTVRTSAPFAAGVTTTCPNGGTPVPEGTVTTTGSGSVSYGSSCTATWNGTAWSPNGTCYSDFNTLVGSTCWTTGPTTTTTDTTRTRTDVSGGCSGTSKNITTTTTFSGLYTTDALIAATRDEVKGLAFSGTATKGASGAASLSLCSYELYCRAKKMEYVFKLQTMTDYIYKLEWDEVTVLDDETVDMITRSFILDGNGDIVTTPPFVLDPPTREGISYVGNLRVKYKDKQDPGGVPGTGSSPSITFSSGNLGGCAGCGGDVGSSAAQAGMFKSSRGVYGRFKPTTTVLTDGESIGMQYDSSLGSGGGSKVGRVNPRFNMFMGGLPGGGDAGVIALDVFNIDPSNFSPGILKFDSSASGVEKVNSGGVLRQVKAPQGLMDLVVVNGFKFEARFYPPSQVGAQNPTTLIYATSGSPLVTYTFENPDASATIYNRYKITEIRGASSKAQIYSYTAATKTWLVDMPDGVTQARTQRVPMGVGYGTEHVTEHLRSGGNVVKRGVRKYIRHSSGIGPVILSQIRLESGADVEFINFTYDTWPDYNTMSALVLKPSRKEYSSGYWKTYTYPDGRLGKVVTRLGSNSVSSDENLNERTERVYTPVTTDDNGTYEPELPRVFIQYWKSTPIRKTYTIVTSYEKQTIEAATPTAQYDDPNNLVTIEQFYNTGAWANRPSKTRYPDGTMAFYSYATVGSDFVTTEDRGAPDNADINLATGIVLGTQTVSTVNNYGHPVSTLTRTLNATNSTMNNLVLVNDVYSSFDSFSRPTVVTHLNQRTESKSFGCCTLDSETDMDGVTTSYGYDNNNRLTSVTRLGIVTTYLLDAAGRRLVTLRKGTDNSEYPIERVSYDGLGKIDRSTNALNGVTTYSEALVGDERIVTTTYPDLGTKIETYDSGNRLLMVTGTAVSPVRYTEGVVSDGGIARYYSESIQLDSLGADTGNVSRRLQDFLGRTYKTIYAGTTTELSFFNSIGQLWKSVDGDGVATLYFYDGLGRQEATVLDMNQNDVYDAGESSEDRLTRVVQDYVSKTYGSTTKVVSRSRTYVLDDKDPDANDATDTAPVESLVSTVESSADGLVQWKTHPNQSGVTMQWMVYSTGGNRYLTNTAPDGSFVVTRYLNGRVNYVQEKNAANVQLKQATYAYDTHGRVLMVTDTRAGTTTVLYNNADQTVSVKTPLPGNGQAAQTTISQYDNMGRVKGTVESDGTQTVNEYWPTGLVKKRSGTRTYATSYTYDPQGRMLTMTTWKDELGVSGAAVTTWMYDPDRGWLVRKSYDSEGDTTDDFAYTAAGRLQVKENERGISEVNGFNNAGQVTSVEYAQGGVISWTRALNYDRRGRLKNVSLQDGMITTYSYNLTDQVVKEGYSGGTGPGSLAGFSVDRNYDAYLRENNVSAKQGSTVLQSTTFGYETAKSRLTRVHNGNFFADYTYVANSHLLNTVTIKSNVTGTASTVLTVTRQWDNLNRLNGIKSVAQGSGTVYSYGYAYNDANQRVQTVMADGSYWIYEYDRLGQVVSGKRFWQDGSPVAGQQYEYQFDDIGNRTAARSGGDATGANLRSTTYASNSKNQYTSRQVPATLDVLGFARGAVTVTLDAGSPVSASHTKGEYFRHEVTARASDTVAAYPNITVTAGGSSSQSGRVFVPVKNEVITHDVDGNLTQDGRWTYSWDANNQLTNMVSVSLPNSPPSSTPVRVAFRYDHLGRRIYKAVFTIGSGTSPAREEKYLYNRWNLVAILNGANALQRTFLWGTDLSGSMSGAGGVGGLVAVTEHTGTTGTHVPAYDGNGNVTTLITGQGGSTTATASYEYGPFGESLRTSGTEAKLNPFRFSTKYLDDETDLLYYGYRYYSTSLGRWLSRDPIQERGGINLYCSLQNQPINNVDALGLEGFWRGACSFCKNIFVKHGREGYDLEKVSVDYMYGDGDLASYLLAQYTSGSGRPYNLSVDQMIEARATIDWTQAADFNGYLKNAFSGNCVPVSNLRLLAQAGRGITLGRFWVIADGQLCGCGDDWCFTGTMRFEDTFDFNVNWGNVSFGRFGNPNGRSVAGELQTMWGRYTIPGVDFPVTSDKIQFSQCNTDSDGAQWAGTRLSHFPLSTLPK